MLATFLITLINDTVGPFSFSTRDALKGTVTIEETK